MALLLATSALGADSWRPERSALAAADALSGTEERTHTTDVASDVSAGQRLLQMLRDAQLADSAISLPVSPVEQSSQRSATETTTEPATGNIEDTTELPASSEGASLGEIPQAETVAEVLKLELHLSARQLHVYRGESLIHSYSVAVGREGWNTPTGDFTVFQKQTNPAWEHPFTGEIVPPGPDNPLGTRWIGFWSDGENSIGFHGTPDESVIGTAVSHGCVRMRNEDVLALYEQVSIDTAVKVLP